MNAKLKDFDAAIASPVYAGRPMPGLVAGLPYDDFCRGMHHARALRNAYLRSLANRFVANTVRRVLRRIYSAVAEHAERLHRGPFTSTI